MQQLETILWFIGKLSIQDSSEALKAIYSTFYRSTVSYHSGSRPGKRQTSNWSLRSLGHLAWALATAAGDVVSPVDSARLTRRLEPVLSAMCQKYDAICRRSREGEPDIDPTTLGHFVRSLLALQHLGEAPRSMLRPVRGLSFPASHEPPS